MSRATNHFLAVVPHWGGGGAFILAAIGEAAEAVLAQATAPGAQPVDIALPEGVGLYVSHGEPRVGSPEAGEPLVFWRVEWRAASPEDFERFGYPLSEPARVPASGDGLGARCSCAMGRRYLPGVVGIDSREPEPVELADHVITWSPRMVLGFPFCCWCGKKNDLKPLAAALERFAKRETGDGAL